MSASQSQQSCAAAENGNLVAQLNGLLAHSGATGHPFLASLTNADDVQSQTIADIAHLLGLLHGSRPSVFEIVAQSPLAPAPDWLNTAMRVFSRERELIARLVLGAGPPPSRFNQTSVEVSVNATRQALVTLASSDRLGCAIGAAVALMIDWESIAAALRKMAGKLDMKALEQHGEWPSRAESLAVLKLAAELPAGDRAVRFGFQAMLAQHQAFWDIVESRAA